MTPPSIASIGLRRLWRVGIIWRKELLHGIHPREDLFRFATFTMESLQVGQGSYAAVTKAHGWEDDHKHFPVTLGNTGVLGLGSWGWTRVKWEVIW